MDIFVIVLGIIFTVLSVAILSYISMATMLGPWIAPTLVLLGSLFIKFKRTDGSVQKMRRNILLAQAIGAGGGIIAVGIGFSVPILYFLDPYTFNNWIQNACYFCTMASAICFAAGSYGILLGRNFAHNFIVTKKLPFPVSKLTYSVISSQEQTQQLKQLLGGTISTVIFSFLRDGAGKIAGVLPRTIYFFKSFVGDSLALALWPTLWSMGFVVGLPIVMPLVVGMISKHLVLYPLNHHAEFLPFALFQPLAQGSFVLAFCSGLVVSELVLGVLKNPYAIVNTFTRYTRSLAQSKHTFLRFIRSYGKDPSRRSPSPKAPEQPLGENGEDVRPSFIHGFSSFLKKVEPLLAIAASCAVLSYLGFSLIAQVTLLIFVALATYEISYIGCDIGLIQFGRFASFVLLPMLLLFKLNFIQVTAICVFFNICAAVASDLLFDYKTGTYCDLDRSEIHIGQWIGLLVTSLTVGLILYVIFSNLTIGSEMLFCQRGRSKVLLIQSLNLNLYVVSFGFLFGLLLKKMRISPTMTFGGIIMPNRITIGFVIGGLISALVKRKEDYFPFCAGVFASETLWVITSLLCKMFLG